MNAEHVKVQINNALYLIELISDDVEDNFIGTQVDSAVKARAAMTVSALAILSDYLRHICEGVEA